MAPARRPPAPASSAADARLLRAVRFAALPGNTIAKACARYRITPAAFRRARATHGPIQLTLDDLILSGLRRRRPSTPGALQPYLDWLDHAVYSEAELGARLRGLARRGLVRARAGGWVLVADWP